MSAYSLFSSLSLCAIFEIDARSSVKRVDRSREIGSAIPRFRFVRNAAELAAISQEELLISFTVTRCGAGVIPASDTE